MQTQQHTFSEIPRINIPRAVFNRPHNLKTTMGTDYLYPIYCDECLPSDSFVFEATFYGRFSNPALTPIMDGLYLDTFFFAIPIRLIDKDFAKVMGEVTFGDATTEYLAPVLNTGTGVAVGSLSDYIGIPPGVPNLDFLPYWHRAYNLVWNEWFRSGSLCEPVKVAGVSYDGTVDTESLSDYTLLKRCKVHDYFTSCLNSPQRGDPIGISLVGSASLSGFSPLEGTLPSAWTGFAAPMSTGPLNGTIRKGSTSVTDFGIWFDEDMSSGGISPKDKTFSKLGTNFSSTSSLNTAAVDLSGISAVTINQLRESFALQHLLEMDERGGYSRIIEIVREHFSVESPDLRAQRPEYLGGFSQPLSITSVPQTSATDSTSPQGNLAAYVSVGGKVRWIKSFTEHCIILGLANIRADLSYQQGLPRMFSRRSRYDWYWPALANLGEQSVLNKEIYAQGSSVTDSSGNVIDDKVFGYQERWAEYRYHPNMITGLFRSTASLSLDYWHLAQKFDSLPQLNSEFIEESVPISRALAVTDEPPFLLDAYFDVKCARPMPLYSVPGVGKYL